MSRTMRDHAKDLAARGFYVFPVIRGAKTPAIKQFTERAVDSGIDMLSWWTETDPNPHNIGIITSRYFDPSGKEPALIVVDIDNKIGNQGTKTVQELKEKGFALPKTCVQKTPSGGFHLIYKTKTAVKQGSHVLGPGVDIRSRGGYIVGAGSKVPKGVYTIDDTPVASAPRWVIDLCNKSPDVKKRDEKPMQEISLDGVKPRAIDYLENHAPLAVEGAGGDFTTFKVACRLKDLGCTETLAFELMGEYWNDRCQPSWAPDELESKINNAFIYSQNEVGVDSPEADFEPVEDPSNAKDPIGKMNENFAFIVLGGQSTILRIRKTKVEYWRPTAFHDKLAPYTMQIGDRRSAKKPVSKVWFYSERRKSYEDLDFLPEKKTLRGTFNLWRGFAETPIKIGEKGTDEMREGVDMFKSHLFENICQNDDDSYRWLFGYFAHLIQRPWEKPLTAVVIKGEKGTGKNAAINQITPMLHEANHLLASDPRHLLGNFNKHIETVLLFTLDEGFWSGDKKAESRLKDLITGRTHLIEQKMKEVYQIRNLARIVILSNEDWVVPATREERRFAVFNIGNKKRQDTDFFTRMIYCMRVKKGTKLLMREFLDYDLSRIDLNQAPQTIGLLDQKLESLDPIASWWHSCLMEGQILNLEFSDDSDEWPDFVNKEALRKAFIEHSRERNVRSWLPTPATFRKHLAKLVRIEDKRPGGGNSRRRGFGLPRLSDARMQFDDFIGHKLEWPKEESTLVYDNDSGRVIDAATIFDGKGKNA